MLPDDEFIPDDRLVFLAPILSHLPPMFQFSPLILLFDSDKDGFNAGTMLRRVHGNGATIVVVRTTDDTIAGGFASVPWEVVQKGRVGGTGETFVFRQTADARPDVFPWSRHQNHFISIGSDWIAFGGGNGLALHLFNDLTMVSSAPCETFKSPCLLSVESTPCERVQVFGFEVWVRSMGSAGRGYG
mmetsp:Transcript_52850/g.123508  ORF Transcript_52850/g.123508 Transcript_52850/m.123508 type:complete len:187 (-) Transcript_52850:118-678(-)